MGVHGFKDLRRHIGHKIVCVCYGIIDDIPDNVSIECETCNEVLLDFDYEDDVAEKIHHQMFG